MPAPRKRFGQHFLQDQVVISRIVELLAAKKNEHLIEIGPGQGALTLPLLKQGIKLDAVELDRDIIPVLETRSKHVGHLTIHAADVLNFNFNDLKTDDRLLRIFGNLPYNISTPLIFHLLTFAEIISDMLFMLQKEVAERLAAKPDTKSYGRLSVMVQYHCRVEFLLDVPANAFYPPPQVRSGIVKLTPYRSYPTLAHNYPLFESIVRHAFNQRRKTLRNSLKDIVDDATWAQIGLHSDLRPENLSVADFVEISNALNKKGK